jgi:hypothetical protein
MWVPIRRLTNRFDIWVRSNVVVGIGIEQSSVQCGAEAFDHHHAAHA